MIKFFERKKPFISIIAAAAANGVIGRDGAMPWHLPGDLRYFKQVTMGKPVIMGQKTWESLSRRPLPGRANIVLTRRPGLEAPGAVVAHSLPEALRLAADKAAAAGQKEIFIIGGGAVFAQAAPLADKIYLTQILADIDGDCFFKPSLPARDWQKTEVKAAALPEKDSHAYRFLIYKRRRRRQIVPAIRNWRAAGGQKGCLRRCLQRLCSLF